MARLNTPCANAWALLLGNDVFLQILGFLSLFLLSSYKKLHKIYKKVEKNLAFLGKYSKIEVLLGKK